ncbi:hypothetical protein BH11PLA2_BH11PLA2_49220 [soil metagenome]
MNMLILNRLRSGIAGLLAIGILAALPAVSQAQSTWNATSAQLWGTAANWTPNSAAPGSNSDTANSDIGQFGAVGVSVIQFNFGTIGTPYYVGTISMLSTNTVARSFGSNAGTAGTLVLNGSGGNSLILDNQSAVAMTVSPVVGSGTGPMALRITAVNSTINAVGTIAISTAIGEGATAAGITKTGNGLLSLSGASTYTGGTTVNNGILAYLTTASKPAVGITAVSATATLALGTGGTGYFSAADVTSLYNNTLANVTMNATSGVGVDTTVGDITLTASLAGARSLSKLGTGSLTLSGANSFTGGVTVYAGTLNITSAAALGDPTSPFTLLGGGFDNTGNAPITLTNTVQNWNGNFAFIGTRDLNTGTGSITMNANRTVTASNNTLTVGGEISGTGFSLTKNGSGALTLATTNTYTGGTTLSTGTLNLNLDTALPTTGAFTIAGGFLDNTSGAAITMANAFPQTWSGNFSFLGASDGSHDLTFGGTVTLSAARVVTVFAGNLTEKGVISGAFALTKTGAGTLTLTAGNSFSGAVTLGGGQLTLDFATTFTNILATGKAVAANGGTLYLKVGPSASAQTLGAVTVTAGASIIALDTSSGSNGTLTLGTLTATTINGALNIISTGGGTRTLTSTSGTLVNGIYSPRITFNGNDFTTTLSVATPFALSAYGAYTALPTGATTSSVNYRIDTPGTLTRTTDGTVNTLKLDTTAGAISLDLDGTNNYTLTVGGLNTSGTTGAILVTGNNNAEISNGFMKGPPAVADLLIHQYSTGTFTVGSVIQNSTSLLTTGLTKAGPGTLILSGANIYTGPTMVGAGTLKITGADNRLPIATALTVNSGATFDLNGFNQQVATVAGLGTYALGSKTLTIFNTTAGNSTLPGNFTGNGSVVIDGNTGRFLLLTGDNSDFNGTYTIKANSAISFQGVTAPVNASVGNVSAITVEGTFSPTVTNLGGTFDFQPAAIYNDTTIIWGNAVPFTIAGNGTFTGISNRGAVRFFGNNDQVFNGNFVLTGSASIVSEPSSNSTLKTRLRTLNGTISGTGDLYLDAHDNTASEFSQFNINGVISVNGGLWIMNSKTTLKFGRTVLNAANTFIGNTRVGPLFTTNIIQSGVRLQLGHTLALQNSTLDLNSDDSGQVEFGTATNAYTLGGLLGSRNLALTDITGNPVALSVGNNGQSPTYFGILSGTGASLTKIGGGTQALSGANSYTGTTTIIDGTLALNASGSIANSSTIIVGTAAGSPAILDATGLTGGSNLISGSFSLTGSQTVAGFGNVNVPNIGFRSPNGTTVSPGASAGTLTITGAATLAGSYKFELATAVGGSASPVSNGASSPTLTHTAYDVLVITGTADLTGLVINISSLDLPLTGFDNTKFYSWTILTSAGLTGSAPTLGTVSGSEFLTGSSGFSLSVDLNNVYLNYAAPEPSLLCGFGVLTVLGLRRFRRVNC